MNKCEIEATTIFSYSYSDTADFFSGSGGQRF